jgi:hypothetical protein
VDPGAGIDWAEPAVESAESVFDGWLDGNAAASDVILELSC